MEETMPIAVGDALPEATGTAMADGRPGPVNLREFVGDKKTVIFGVPGAFTPTCTNDHLPTFAVAADALADAGIEQTICMSTNDIFVLQAWNAAHGAEHITMLADGSGNLTRAMDLGLDLSGLGLGFRCTRFAMIVEGGVVKAVQLEESPGACAVTSASAILAHA
jgi:peroxiredoxin